MQTPDTPNTDPTLTPFARIRLGLVRSGYAPIPAKGKIPAGKSWQTKHETNLAEIQMWDRTFPTYTNTGVLTRTVPTLDFDVLDKAACEAAEPIISRYINGGVFLRRVGNAPKFAVPFRTDIPFKKIQVQLLSPAGKEAKVEFLGDGQQFIVDGRHPDGFDYKWLGTSLLSVPRAELPVIEASRARTLVNALVTMLVNSFGYTVTTAAKTSTKQPPAKSKPNGATTDHVANAAADRGNEDALVESIISGVSLHDPLRDLAAKLIGAGMFPGAVVNRLRAVMMKSASRTARPQEWQERYNDIPRAVDTAQLKYGHGTIDPDEASGSAKEPPEPPEPPQETGGKGDSPLARMNRKYCVVNDGGSVLVFRDRYDEIMGRRIYDRMSAAAFKLLHKNETVLVKAEGGSAAKKPIADVWLSHPKRRTYQSVVFDPSGKAAGSSLNLWRGFGFEPKAADWSKLKAHLRDNVCIGNTLYLTYLMNWMALLVQKPADQGEVAIIMRGKQGVGKGILGQILRRIFGQHGMYVSKSKHLVGAFNSHLRDCVLLFADEAFFAGDRAAEGTLKSLITEDTLTIEPKGQNVILCRNRLHIVMASNHDWVVPAGLDERRYFMLDVGEERMQDHNYFSAILEQMNNGGYSAMLHELLHRDISNFQVRKVPNTDALDDQKKRSFKTEEAWLHEVLARGYIYRSKLGLTDEFSCWTDWASTDLLHESYLDYAKQHNERYPLKRVPFGRFMTEMAQPRRGGIGELVGETLTVSRIDGSKRPESVKRDRPMGYFLGTLTEARHNFGTCTDLTFEWDRDE
jgi:hypothetical protein